MNKRRPASQFLFVAIVVRSGCGNLDDPHEEKLTGFFSGSADSLSFYPDGKILVNLSDDYTWLLEEKGNRLTTIIARQT